MARYDYRCPSCGNVFEVSHGMLEHPTVTCPACGTVAMKVFDASGIVFKGSGFYNTDQRSSSSAPPATTGNDSRAIAKTGNGTKEISRRAEGPSTLAKAQDKPAKPAPAAAKRGTVM